MGVFQSLADVTLLGIIICLFLYVRKKTSFPGLSGSSVILFILASVAQLFSIVEWCFIFFSIGIEPAPPIFASVNMQTGICKMRTRTSPEYLRASCAAHFTLLHTRNVSTSPAWYGFLLKLVLIALVIVISKSLYGKSTVSDNQQLHSVRYRILVLIIFICAIFSKLDFAQNQQMLSTFGEYLFVLAILPQVQSTLLFNFENPAWYVEYVIVLLGQYCLLSLAECFLFFFFSFGNFHWLLLLSRVVQLMLLVDYVFANYQNGYGGGLDLRSLKLQYSGFQNVSPNFSHATDSEILYFSGKYEKEKKSIYAINIPEVHFPASDLTKQEVKA